MEKKESLIPNWLKALLVLGPLVGTLLGVGISYGILRGQVDRNSEDIAGISPYVRSIDSRLSRIEGALNIPINSNSIQKPRLGVH